jgi:hypothetical protein
VARVLAGVRRRVGRLLGRRGLVPGDEGAGPADRFAEASPLLAGLASASVRCRIALGPRAGALVWRLGRPPEVRAAGSRGPRQAQLEGFDLHANVWVPARDRAGLERLCRYLLRPPLAQERRRQRTDGRVLLELRKAWRDGTSHLLFEPMEFLEKLAALTPRPGINLIVYHGVLAPHSRWRALVVAYRGSGAGDLGGAECSGAAPGKAAAGKPRYWSWAALMRRAFDLDVLACPRCGGRLRLLATVEEPGVVRKILAHLGLLLSPDRPGPAPPGPGGFAGATPQNRFERVRES